MTNSLHRLTKLDNAKVILMTFVIIAHTLINSYGDRNAAMIRFICLTYTMPIFFFISGYLSKYEKRASILKKTAKHLLLPCLIFSIINNAIMSAVNPHFYIRYDIAGFAMWYLWALFLYKITWPFMRKIPHILFISILLFLIVPLFPDVVGVRFSLNRLLSFYPFFVFGALLRERNIDILTKVKLSKKLLMGGGALYLISLILLYPYPQITYQTAFNQAFQGAIYIGVLIRSFLLIYIVITGVMFWFVVPTGKVFFSDYGRRTLTVYLWHGCIVLPFAYLVFNPFVEEGLCGKFAMILIPTLTSLLLYGKPFNKFTQKYF